MKSETEIKEAIELCQSSNLAGDPLAGHIRDATVEALRWVLDIDNGDTSPMTFSLAELLESLKADNQQTLQE